MTTPTIFNTCEPRDDVLSGALADADFAADLASVIAGTASPEYFDPARFFADTYPTRGLKDLLANICGRLSGTGDAVGPIFRLDTAYGGGKPGQHPCGHGGYRGDGARRNRLLARHGDAPQAPPTGSDGTAHTSHRTTNPWLTSGTRKPNTSVQRFCAPSKSDTGRAEPDA